MTVSALNIHTAGKDIDLAKRHIELAGRAVTQAANILQTEKQGAAPGSELAEKLAYLHSQTVALEKVIMHTGNAAAAINETELLNL